MSKIKFFTDSTSYFTKDFADKNNIGIVPLKVEFEGKITTEGFPGEFKEFFDALKVSQDFPKTSQPSVGDFAKVFQDAVDDGYEVVAVTISSKLSGTWNSASVAAEMVGSDKVSVVDSESAASNLRLLVERGMELAGEGKSREEIASILDSEKKNMRIDLTVDTLEYLKRGGRLSGAQALVANLLNIRPIIGLRDGKLEPIDKVRGKKKAVESMIANIPENVEKISLCHIFSLEEVTEIKAKLEEKYKGVTVTIDELGPVVGAHLGPQAIGICYAW